MATAEGRVGDKQLIEAWQAGNGEACKELYSCYQAMIYKTIGCAPSVGMSFDEALSEAHYAFFEAAKHWNPDGKASFGTYAKTCIVNRLKHPASPIPADIPADVETPDDMEAVFIRKDSFDRADLLVHGLLSSFEYKVFRFYLLGMKSDEMAAKLDKKKKDIDNAKGRMFRKLKENAELFGCLYFG